MRTQPDTKENAQTDSASGKDLRSPPSNTAVLLTPALRSPLPMPGRLHHRCGCSQGAIRVWDSPLATATFFLCCSWCASRTSSCPAHHSWCFLLGEIYCPFYIVWHVSISIGKFTRERLPPLPTRSSSFLKRTVFRRFPKGCFSGGEGQSQQLPNNSSNKLRGFQVHT